MIFFSRKRKTQSEPLNILLTAFRFPILGRASDHGFLWPIAKGLAQRGHQVSVLSSKSPIGKAQIERDGVKVYYLFDGFPNFLDYRFDQAVYLKFRELHLQNPFDLVHSIDRSSYRIGKNKKKLRVSVAFDVEATDMVQLFSILGMAQETWQSLIATGVALLYKYLTTYFGQDRELLKTADGVFVTTPQQAQFLERYYFYPQGKTYQVPYGIELGDLSPRIESEELKKKYNFNEKSRLALTLSDMTELQTLKNLFQAFEKVAIKKPNSYLVVIGNGPLFKEIEFEALSLALGSRVIMTGALAPEEISDWISLTEVYVNLSARTTGFEPTMIEAMAQKKVVVGSEVSPIANIIEDGQDGFLLRPADAESLAQLLIEIFSGTLSTAEIGLRAREKIVQLFDTKRMAQAIEDAYRKILSL